MDRLDAPETLPDTVSVEIEPPTPLRARIGACCAETAVSFRAIAAVSAQIAALLESGAATIEDLVGLLQAFEQLHAQADERITLVGAMCSSAGSA